MTFWIHMSYCPLLAGYVLKIHWFLSHGSCGVQSLIYFSTFFCSAKTLRKCQTERAILKVKLQIQRRFTLDIQRWPLRCSGVVWWLQKAEVWNSLTPLNSDFFNWHNRLWTIELAAIFARIHMEVLVHN